MREIAALEEYGGCIAAYGLALADCRCLRFSAGETLIRQGMPGEYLYFIVRGAARVQVYHPDGRALSLSYSVSEGVLGEVELLQERGASTDVIAETELICLAYPYWRARAAFEDNIRFVRQLARDLAAKLSRSTGSLVSASFAPAENRMCAYLLREAERGVYRGTLAKAAQATGMSYRHLQRVMHGLCGDGLLRREADGYHLLDADELARRACG